MEPMVQLQCAVDMFDSAIAVLRVDVKCRRVKCKRIERIQLERTTLTIRCVFALRDSVRGLIARGCQTAQRQSGDHDRQGDQQTPAKSD